MPRTRYSARYLPNSLILHNRIRPVPILSPQRKQLLDRLDILNLECHRQLVKHGIRRMRVLLEHFLERETNAGCLGGLL